MLLKVKAEGEVIDREYMAKRFPFYRLHIRLDDGRIASCAEQRIKKGACIGDRVSINNLEFVIDEKDSNHLVY